MATIIGTPAELLPAYRFKLLFGDPPESTSHWSEVSGLGSEISVISNDVLNRSVGPLKWPGDAACPDVVFTRGMTTDTWLFDLQTYIIRFAAGEIDFTVSLAFDAILLIYNRSDRNPKLKFTLHDAWPSKLEFGKLDANASALFMESMTLTVDRISLEAIT